jgi:putative peptide zinc metalloprotease protein
MRKVKKARAAIFAAVAVVTVAGVLLIPTPLRVQGSLVLTAAKPDEVYAEVPGRLMELKVRDGDQVKKDQILAALSNPQKQRDLLQLQEQHDANFVKARFFGAVSDPDYRARSREHDQMANDLEPAIEKLADDVKKLILVAPRDGTVLGVPAKETIGQYLKPGKPFCEVADPHQVEAHMILDQSDIDLVRLNRRAWIKIYGDSEETFRSHVGEIAKRNREDVPPELSNTMGGEIATKQDTKTGQQKPLTAVYEVIVPLDNSQLLLHPGQRGFAKIDGGTHTLGWWLWRLTTKTFHFTL